MSHIAYIDEKALNISPGGRKLVTIIVNLDKLDLEASQKLIYTCDKRSLGIFSILGYRLMCELTLGT